MKFDRKTWAIIGGGVAGVLTVDAWRVVRPARNWLYETSRQELRRRIVALEEHIKWADEAREDMEDRITRRMLIALDRALRGDDEPEPDADPMTRSLPLLAADEVPAAVSQHLRHIYPEGREHEAEG